MIVRTTCRAGSRALLLQALHERVTLLADARVFQLEAMQILVELAIRLLQLVPLMQTLGATILCVAAILEGAPLLLQADDLLTWTAVQALVQFTHRQRGQHVVVDAILQRGGAVGAGARAWRVIRAA